ncbi:MAG: DUF255 domain-containing protein, partial [Patescibacteria group bacterium]
MRMKILALSLFILLFLFIPLHPSFASSHYSSQHSEDLKNSGKIKWQEYGPKVYKDAVAQNMPIFLVLTAPSWCYWCHVYSSEDYLYNEAIYPLINEKFIPVYVDADKRQDLTRQFLEGGWPSTRIMAPSGERIFGYSGPRPIPFMVDNLNQAVEYVKTHSSANQKKNEYQQSTSIIPTTDQLTNLISTYKNTISQSYDPLYGGFGESMKFPQARSMDYALEIYKSTNDPKWLNIVENTLKSQYTNIDEITTKYRIFDPIEGGFHRYATQRDGTVPHYEKMLYDNAKLLKTYSHLLQLQPNNLIAKDVIDKTDNYIQNNWYDTEKGGFYGNTDVGEHEAYYGQVNRPDKKPRIEKTKYTDWNSEAIMTYLYLFKTTGDEKYKSIAEQSLDFFQKEMITDKGPYHYQKEDGTKELRGSLLDNAYLLTAFVEGYDILHKEEYKVTAQKIADYSLNNLYDWYGGGFFERNSPDTELYAPGENIVLTKPAEENGIMAYALLNLYTQTQNPLYLNAAIKTVGSKLSEIGGLDNNYYYVKSGESILQNNLLSDFTQKQKELESIEKTKQEFFWATTLDHPFSSQFKVSDVTIPYTKSPLLLFILITFLAGIISFISPCSLSIVPAYLASTFKSSKHSIKGMEITFFLGLSIV